MAGFVLPIISGLAGLFGGGQQGQTQTNSNQSGTQNQQFSSGGSTNPNLSPYQQQLAQLFTQGSINQYGQGTNLAPYTSQGLQQIQSGGAAQRKMTDNVLASRGLSYSPAAATADTQSSINTGNQMNQFLQGVPLLQHQLQQGNLQQLMQAFGVQPTGVTSTQSGTSQGQSQQQGNSTSTQFGNPLGGLLGGFGAGAAAPGGFLSPGSGFDLGSFLKKIFGGAGGAGIPQVSGSAGEW